MTRPRLEITQLEDRTTPAVFKLSTMVSYTNIVSTSLAAAVPPTDPMDNPPPVQPAPTGTTSGTTTPVSPPPVSPPVPTYPSA